jgi:peptidoglycan/xylan/chitin deacetylase (PgdA/CDA1 family)
MAVIIRNFTHHSGQTAMISRRQFLKALTTTLLGANLPTYYILPKLTDDITVPPCLMLHSRHWRVLPDLLEKLVARGYEGITYMQWEYALLWGTPLPAQPVIISIDDLALDVKNPAFDYFERMKKNFADAKFKAVFGIITRPNLVHDEDRWAEVAAWSLEGMELATHTSYHSNLDNPKFTEIDYRAEIVDSAEMIRLKTGQPVRTLITPYGSGYDLATQTLNPYVHTACQQANLRFVAGIATGVHRLRMTRHEGDILYTARIQPSTEYTVNDSLYYIRYW